MGREGCVTFWNGAMWNDKNITRHFFVQTDILCKLKVKVNPPRTIHTNHSGVGGGANLEVHLAVYLPSLSHHQPRALTAPTPGPCPSMRSLTVLLAVLAAVATANQVREHEVSSRSRRWGRTRRPYFFTSAQHPNRHTLPPHRQLHAHCVPSWRTRARPWRTRSHTKTLNRNCMAT